MPQRYLPQFRIQAVAQRTGIAAATLRAWERRYGIPRPLRTDSAYRTYSESDVELIEEMRRLCGSGLSPADAASLLKQRASTDTQRLSSIERENDAAQTPRGASDVHEAVVQRLVTAVRAMNVPAIESELLHARSLGSSTQIFEKVLRPALHTVGQLWHDGEISIGHEHLATEILSATARDLLRLAQPFDASRTALLACFADETHAAPLYGIGLRLTGWGCRVVVLGALTPPAALAPAVKRLAPTVVGLSATVAPSRSRARELIEGYANACGDVPWIVGGQAAQTLHEQITEAGGLVAPADDRELHTLLRRVFGDEAQRRSS